MYPFTVQLPYVNGYVSILIHGYIINRYTPPASARITPFISNSNSNALIRFTGMLVSITNVLICNPSGILPSRFTIRSSSSLKSGNNSRCTVFSVLGLLSHPMAFTKSSADVISTAWFFLIRLLQRKYSINSLVYWVTYVHNVVYSFYRSMIYCYINSTQRCAGSIVIDIIPTNGADKRKFFPFAPYFPVTNVIKRYFYPYFPAIIGIKGYSFPYFPYLSGIMKIKTALYSLFSRLDWHKTVVFPCLGEIYEGIRSLSWEIPVT